MTTAAAMTWESAGGLRVKMIWSTVPIQVNWNKSVSATETGRTLIA